MPEGARFGVRSFTVTELMDDILRIYHRVCVGICAGKSVPELPHGIVLVSAGS